MTTVTGNGIVIAGRGVDAWMTAAALARALGEDGIRITVVEAGSEPSEQPFGAGDSSLPPPAGFNHELFPGEGQLVAACDASWSNGIALSGWSGQDATYFHPFGTVGASFGPVAFHQVVQRLRQAGETVRLGNYSLAAMAAQAGRFQLPTNDPRSVLSTCRQGLHVDLGRLSELERADALRRGVVLAKGELDTVQRDAQGAMSALLTTAGERLEGSLFIDASGIHACLIDETPGAGWESWSDWLTCDRVLSAKVETPQAPLPYSHAEARSAGWVQYLPMQGQTVLNAVYDSEIVNEDDVLEVMEEFAGQGTSLQPFSSELAFGRCHQPWRENCVALGKAAALIDPVGLSNLQLLRSGINRLASLLPGGADLAVVAAEYNRQTVAELNHARDFALLHYRLNGRQGEPFWDRARKMAVSAALGYKLQLYANLGRVAMYDFEPLDEISWINLFDEHGVQPRQLHPIASGIGVDELKQHAERIRTAMTGALRKMPLHADYLGQVRSAYAGTNQQETQK